MSFIKNFNRKDKATLNRKDIAKHRRLSQWLINITDMDVAEQARLYWQSVYNPFQGYNNIHHRSQKKKRLLARRNMK